MPASRAPDQWEAEPVYRRWAAIFDFVTHPHTWFFLIFGGAGIALTIAQVVR